MHVPTRCEAVRDAMPALFDFLCEETEASVNQNIVPFAEFLAHLVDEGLKGELSTKLPA